MSGVPRSFGSKNQQGERSAARRRERSGKNEVIDPEMATRPTQKTLGMRPAPADSNAGKGIGPSGRGAARSGPSCWPRSAWPRGSGPTDTCVSAVDPDAVWAQAERDFVAGRYDRVDVALQRLSRLRPPSPLDHMLRAQYAAARKAARRGPRRAGAGARRPLHGPASSTAGRPDRAAARPRAFRGRLVSGRLTARFKARFRLIAS